LSKRLYAIKTVAIGDKKSWDTLLNSLRQFVEIVNSIHYFDTVGFDYCEIIFNTSFSSSEVSTLRLHVFFLNMSKEFRKSFEAHINSAPLIFLINEKNLPPGTSIDISNKMIMKFFITQNKLILETNKIRASFRRISDFVFTLSHIIMHEILSLLLRERIKQIS